MKDNYASKEGRDNRGAFPTAPQLSSTDGLTKEGPLGQRCIKQRDAHTAGPALTLLRTISSGVDPGPPPDGGLKAWTQVVAGHLVVFNCWGYINSFGLFQAYYVTALGRSPSTISWVGSVQILLVFLVGTFSGRAMDAGYYRATLIAGSILQLLGVFMTSLSTTYWQLFLAQGICQGLGDGLIFCPTVSLMATYFSTKRSLAISCAASGAATGGVVFPIIAQQLLPKIGFGWTVRVMGFVILANLAIVITLARTRIPPRTTGPTIEWAAFKELPYVLFTIGMFLKLWGVYFAYYYVTPFGRDIIHVSPSTSITLLLILNGVGVPGRIVPALLADRYFGVLNLLIPTVFCAGVLLYCWTAVHSMGGQIVFVIIYGYFGAGVQGLFPATLSSLTTDMKKMGVRIGMVFSIISIACLTGPPLAGALIQKREGDYLYAQIFGGTVMVCGSLTLIAARIAQTGWNLKRRM